MVMTTGEVVGGPSLSRRVCRSVNVRGRIDKASAGAAAHPAGGDGVLATLPPPGARVEPRPHLRKVQEQPPEQLQKQPQEQLQEQLQVRLPERLHEQLQERLQ